MNKETYLHCFWLVVSYGWELASELLSEELFAEFAEDYIISACECSKLAELDISDYINMQDE